MWRPGVARALKTVGVVAGVVAVAATGIGALAAAGALGAAAAAGGVGVIGIGGTASIAAAASAISAVSNLAAGATSKKPIAQGAVNQTVIGANQPMPYVMGRTYCGGSRVHEAGYGGTVSKVKNPYRSMVDVYSLGPIQGIEALCADFVPISFSGNAATGYYAGFLYRDAQLGACPEPNALAGPFGAIPQWSAAHKLSGKAAVLWTLKFDKDGKRYSSGIPQFGAVLNGVYVYDPRQDSTYPGGAGDCRPREEATYVGGAAAENPACHGITYALGRWQGILAELKKVFGPGFEASTIDMPAWVAFANVCDANGFKVGGTIYEAPGISKWNNLKLICQAGAGKPVWVGGKLSVVFSSPKVALDTIEADDLADGETVIPAMKGWNDRLNGIVPRFRSEQNKWEYEQSDLVTSATYVAEDRGEERHEERQYDLVQDKDQAAKLAAYELADGREFGPIVLPCKPRLIEYKIGAALLGGASLAELGLAGVLMVVTGRSVDPGSSIVTLTLESETTAKHAFALGQTGTAPPSATITTGQDLDGAVFENIVTTPEVTGLIGTSSQLGFLLTGTDTSISPNNHARRYDDRSVQVAGATITGLSPDTQYYLYYEDPDRAGGAVTYSVTTDYFSAFPSALNPYRHYAGFIRTDVVGGTGTTGGGALPPGGGGAAPPGGSGDGAETFTPIAP